MKYLLKSEELLLFILSLYLFSLLDFSWWLFAALFLVPDIGMLGYLVNNKTGAVTYNITHHKAVAIICFLAGFSVNSPALQFAGLILLAHSSFDRILGYGLKTFEGFKSTHLGSLN